MATAGCCSPGQIAAIVIPIIVAVVFLILILCLCYHLRRRKQRHGHYSIESGSDEQLHGDKPTGLKNFGNTCYFNSTMQAINQTPVFRDVLQSSPTLKKVDAGITPEMKQFFQEVNPQQPTSSTFGTKYYEPRALFKALSDRSPRFQVGRQQDSHEALRHLMDGIKAEQKQAQTQHDARLLTVVDEVFGGHFLTVFCCKHCHMSYHLFEPFLDVSLPIAFEQDERQQETTTIIGEQITATGIQRHKNQTSAISRSKADSRGRQLDDSSDSQPITAADELALHTATDTSDSHTTHTQMEDGDTAVRPSVTDFHDLQTTGNTTAVVSTRQGHDHEQYEAAISDVCQRLELSRNDPKYTTVNTLLNCFRFFSRVEQLDEYFCLACNEGETEYVMHQGTKQTLVFNPPAILTIHFKRFEQTNRGFAKVSKYIQFDEMLNLRPFCSRLAWRQPQDITAHDGFKYRLYGVVIHHGRTLNSGHYTACVRVRDVDVETSRQFLQKTFLDRQLMMSKEKLIELVSLQAPSHRLESSTLTSVYRTDDTIDQWFDISDTSVQKTDLGRVLLKEAYLLFYERLR